MYTIENNKYTRLGIYINMRKLNDRLLCHNDTVIIYHQHFINYILLMYEYEK